MLLLKKSLQGLIWCGREDSNFHGCYPTATSTLRVYQFRHDRTIRLGRAPYRRAAQRCEVENHAPLQFM